MARFNKPTEVQSQTVNHEGAVAYQMGAEMELVTILLTSFAQDSYYESADKTFDRLIGLIDALPDKTFAAKAAIYARNQFGMRSISHVVAGEIAAKVKGESWTKRFIEQVVRRPDDMTEILSYYQSKYGRTPIPNSLKKGFALAFNKFDRYQLAKYRGERQAVSLIDVVNISHPVPTEHNKEALRLLVADKLRSEDTRDAVMTEIGQRDISDTEKIEKKAEAWTDLLKTDSHGRRKLGYFALVKNLRNIIEQAPEQIDTVCEALIDTQVIRKSLVMPFRLYTAYKQIQDIHNYEAVRVLDALATALNLSCENIPGLPGNSIIGIDNSHSMKGNLISPKSVVTRADIACLLGAMMFERTDNTVVMLFADTHEIAPLMKSNSVLANMEIIRRVDVGLGHNTNGYLVPEQARRSNLHVDNFLIFTDLQMYDAEGVRYDRTPPTPGRSFKKEITKYRRDVNPKAKVYSFDCAGYGTLQMPAGDPKSYLLAGFSEKMFDTIKLLEKDRNAFLNMIKTIDL